MRWLEGDKMEMRYSKVAVTIIYFRLAGRIRFTRCVSKKRTQESNFMPGIAIAGLGGIRVPCKKWPSARSQHTWVKNPPHQEFRP